MESIQSAIIFGGKSPNGMVGGPTPGLSRYATKIKELEQRFCGANAAKYENDEIVDFDREEDEDDDGFYDEVQEFSDEDDDDDGSGISLGSQDTDDYEDFQHTSTHKNGHQQQQQQGNKKHQSNNSASSTAARALTKLPVKPLLNKSGQRQQDRSSSSTATKAQRAKAGGVSRSVIAKKPLPLRSQIRKPPLQVKPRVPPSKKQNQQHQRMGGRMTTRSSRDACKLKSDYDDRNSSYVDYGDSTCYDDDE